MTPRFNLVDAPWIPCLLAADGTVHEQSLRDVLVQAPGIREISHPSPLVTVALHRLLLAILHRHFARGYGPTSEGEWAELRQRGAFDAAAIDGYLARWRGRFELFDAERPFYQVGKLDFQYEWPIVGLTHELASSGNAATLFDHTTDCALSAAQAARYLVAFQAFAVGGTVSLYKHEDPKLFKSADAAPLVKAAVALVKGTSLFETLSLNLVCYDPTQDEPFACEGDDRPAWERDEETRADDRWPAGHLDLLTWQSRRLRLRPEVSEDGAMRVPAVVIMKGYQFPDRFHRRRRETMLAFVGRPKAKAGEDPWPAVSFREERSLWRDSLALFQSVAHGQPQGEERDRPQTVSWLAQLAEYGVLEPSLVVPVEFFGVSSNQANIHFWRHERLPLPLAYLRDEHLVADLSLALAFAEEVGRELQGSVYTLAKLLLAPSAGQANARKPTGKVIGPLVQSLAPERRYWPRLEEAFSTLLVGLAQAPPGDSAEEHRLRALAAWQRTVLGAARRAFDELTSSLDTSARSLKAVARAEQALHAHLRRVVKKRGIQTEEEEARESTDRS
ncbi:MAG: type I-E CRISPR-associated protein Cse1/CasA [Chloroflexi bacterium]|nr:type I-E CRISPR-associated protein Cse1/CasA [Chloroflexota bacterium]